MTEEFRQEVREDLSAAERKFTSAEFNLSQGAFGEAVADLYYVCFHYLRAVLLTRGTKYQSHKGVLNGFHKHFVNEGLAEAELGKFLNNLAKARNDADYKYGTFDAATVSSFRDQTLAFRDFAVTYLGQFSDWVLVFRGAPVLFDLLKNSWESIPAIKERWIYNGVFHRRAPSESGLPSQITVVVLPDGTVRCRYPKKSVLLALPESPRDEALSYLGDLLEALYIQLAADLPADWRNDVSITIEPRYETD
ncbi:MAG TPA: HEPN domain-containing protein [bacterium]|nr:HEPN domain-containing protein [bacterium]